MCVYIHWTEAGTEDCYWTMGCSGEGSLVVATFSYRGTRVAVHSDATRYLGSSMPRLQEQDLSAMVDAIALLEKELARYGGTLQELVSNGSVWV